LLYKKSLVTETKLNCSICFRCRHGRRHRGQGGAVALPYIFIHGIDIVDRGLIVLFFGHFFH